MRCPDCNKFVGLEFQDPEDVSLDMSGDDGELSEDGDLTVSVTMNCRIVRNCAECGQEMKEANIEASEDDLLIENAELADCVEQVDGKWKWKEGHGHLTISDTSTDQIEEGGGRYAKSYFGAEVTYEIKCRCGTQLHEGEISDKVAASAMDELV